MFAIPYILIYLFIYFAFICNNKKSVTGLFLFFASISYLIVFLGLRGFVSTDWLNYYPFYEKFPLDKTLTNKYISTSGWEKGVPLLMGFFKRLGFSYFSFCFISTFFDIVVLYIFFKKYLQDKILLGLCFFLLFGGVNIEFNLLRCSKAIDFFLLSIKYIENKKDFWKYFLLNFCGFIFHSAALFYVLFYFIYHIRIFERKKLVITIWIIGFIIFLLRIQIISVFLNSVANFLPARISWLVKHYTVLSKVVKEYGFGLGFFERFFSFLLFIHFVDSKKVSGKYKPFFIMGYIYFFCYLFFSEVYAIVDRLAIMMVISYWILFPVIYSGLSIKKKKLFLVLLLFYSILKLYAIYGNNKQFFYESILFSNPDYSYRKLNFL